MASETKTRSRPATAKTIGLRGALATGLSVLLVGVISDGASAAERSFKPVEKKARAYIFNPRGIEASEVRKAHIKLHVHSETKKRRVRTRRVRKALESSRVRAGGAAKLKVRRPEKARDGKLEIVIKPSPPEEPPVEEPPVEEPPVEEPPVEEPPVEEPPVEEPPVEEPPAEDCGYGTFSGQKHPGACWRPYSDSSPFNRGVGASPRTLSSSSSIVSRLTGFGKGQGIIGGIADTSGDYDHPLYFSNANDPVYTIHCLEDWGTCEVEGMRVRIPTKARPAAGGDGSLGIIDQASGWEYDFWQARSRPADGGVLSVSWGGRTPIGTPTADGLDSNATAAHFGTAAGIIRPSELEAGKIEHALFLMVKCTNGTFVWPAKGPGVGRTCSSMGLPSNNAPAMGQHFFLDMTEAEINVMPVPGWKKTILRAMAEYGMFVGDTGGTTWRLKIESGSSYTSFGYEDPWVRLGRKFGVPSWVSSDGKTKYSFDTAAGVDWSRLKVADPCVSRGTC